MKSKRKIATELWYERIRITKARHDAVREAMRAYDKDVYLPAVAAMQERCETEVGHEPGEWQNNGWGRSWRECKLCRKKIEEEYYDLSI